MKGQKVKLIFPESDCRSNGKPINKKRPWLKQGAKCKSVEVVRRYTSYVSTVQFEEAPKDNYDLVSPEFLKSS